MPHKRRKIIRAIVLFFFISLYFAKTSFVVNAQGAVKTYKGSNYTVNYPATGFDDDKLSFFRSFVEGIILFLEPYGAIKFQNIQINVIDRNRIGSDPNLEAITWIERQIVDLPVADYNQPVIVHEFCHLIEHHVPLPSWLQEGQAENCARKFFESHGLTNFAKAKDDDYNKYIPELKDVRSKVPDWIQQTDFREDKKVFAVNQRDSYFLLKELLEKVKMSDVLPKLRNEFGIENSTDPNRFSNKVPNDAIICAFNSSTSQDVFSIFQKYEFKIPDCSSKPKPSPRPSATPTGEPNLALIFAIPSFLTLFILVVFFIFLIKRLVNRKTKRKVIRKVKRRK